MYRAGVLKIAYEEESIYSDKYYICDDYSPVNCVLSKAVIIESENKSEEEFQRYSQARFLIFPTSKLLFDPD